METVSLWGAAFFVGSVLQRVHGHTIMNTWCALLLCTAPTHDASCISSSPILSALQSFCSDLDPSLLTYFGCSARSSTRTSELWDTDTDTTMRQSSVCNSKGP